MTKSISEPKTIALFGLGYVGTVTASCLAHIGHRVIGIDRDQRKVESINAKKAPFFEPGLEDVIRGTTASGRLSATVDTREALADADVAMVCVGTPSGRDGELDLDQLVRVCEDIAKASASRTKQLIVTIRSTVLPGTCDDVVTPILSRAPIAVVSNPEFLREGSAIDDFLRPSLLVIGGNNPGATALVADLYQVLDVEACIVSLRTAEMIKYACNAFHAVKVSFANEIGAISASLGVDGNEVMETLCRDTKLNISSAYLKPGFPFGGSCLPKDLRGLNWRANQIEVCVPLLGSTLLSNAAHLDRAIQAVMSLGSVKLGILGLAFKEGTDDLRESPGVSLVKHLIEENRNIRIFDPHIELASIYGSNRDFLLNTIPQIERLLQPDLESVIVWADYAVIVQKPSPDHLRSIRLSGCRVLDLVGMAAWVP